MIHIFTKGTAAQANTLLTQLTKHLPQPFQLYCTNADERWFDSHINVLAPYTKDMFAWEELFYVNATHIDDIVLFLPTANVRLTKQFADIFDIPYLTLLSAAADGSFMFRNAAVLQETTERDYVRYDTFREYLSAINFAQLPLTSQWTLMPQWWEQDKDLEVELYNPDLGLYNTLPNKVHIELCDSCSLKCPMCIQTDVKDPSRPSMFVRGKELFLSDIKKAFPPEFIKESNLTHVELCGNVGEPTEARDFLAICQYFVDQKVTLSIVTNGMKDDSQFWIKLAIILRGTESRVVFGIDGATEDVYSNVRPYGDLLILLDNARLFMLGGGNAIWKYVVYDQPFNDVNRAEQLAKELHFEKFVVVGTRKAPTYPIADPIELGADRPTSQDSRTSADSVTQSVTMPLAASLVQLHTIKTRKAAATYIERRVIVGASVRCQAKVQNRFYLDAGGNVFPCAFTAMEALKAGRAQWFTEPFPYNWIENSIHHHSLKDILCNEFFTRYMSTMLSLGPTLFCQSMCGVKS
jgi:hypothetical protein